MSELVTKWLSTTGIDPARLIDTTDVEFDQLQLSVDNSLQLSDTLSKATAVRIPRQERTKLVSLSIEIEDEAKVNATAEACILGKRAYFRKTIEIYSLINIVILQILSLLQTIWPCSNAIFHTV